MSVPTQPTLGELTRVTVRGPRRSVDLVVPTQAPVGEWWPSLIRTVIPDEPDDLQGWRLTRADGRPIGGGDGLGSAGVADGELLLLEPLVENRPAVLVTDVIEELTRRPVPRLTLAARRPWMIGGAAAAVCAAIAITIVATIDDIGRATLPLAVLAAVLLGATLLLAHRLRDDAATVATGLLATVAAGTATACLVASSSPDPLALMLRPAAVALLVQVVLLACGIAARAAATGVIWGVASICVGALIALAINLGAGVAAAVAVVILTLALPAAPRASAYLARLTALPGSTGIETESVGADEDEGAIAHRSAHAHRVLGAILASSAGGVIGMWAVVLGTLAAPWSWLLVAASGVAVASASRDFGRVVHIYSLTLVGLAGLTGGLIVALSATGSADVQLWLAVPLVALAAGLVVAGVDTRLDLPTVGLLRTVRAASLVTRALLPVLMLGATGVFAWAWSVGSRIGTG